LQNLRGEKGQFEKGANRAELPGGPSQHANLSPIGKVTQVNVLKKWGTFFEVFGERHDTFMSMFRWRPAKSKKFLIDLKKGKSLLSEIMRGVRGLAKRQKDGCESGEKSLLCGIISSPGRGKKRRNFKFL